MHYLLDRYFLDEVLIGATFARSKRKDAYEFKESSLHPRFICPPAGAGRHVGGDY